MAQTNKKPRNPEFRKTAVSGRLSSYQKMKQKYEASIRQLTDDIITLVEEKDFVKTSTVKMQWRMRLDVEKAIWMGDATCNQRFQIRYVAI